jgi:hypothetical protein
LKNGHAQKEVKVLGGLPRDVSFGAKWKKSS